MVLIMISRELVNLNLAVLTCAKKLLLIDEHIVNLVFAWTLSSQAKNKLWLDSAQLRNFTLNMNQMYVKW